MSFKMSYDEEKIDEQNIENAQEIMKKFEEFKSASKIKTAIIVVIAVLITFCVTIIFYGKYLNDKGALIVSQESSKTIEDALNRVSTVMGQRYRGDTPSEDELMEGAIKGYVEAYGDPYTEYLTADEWKQLDESLSDFVGIGVYIGEKRTSSDAVILGPTSDDSPAALAGLKAGDVIIEVDLEDVSGKGASYVSSKVRGVEGSTVKIKVLRGDQTLEFSIKRARIKSYEIRHEMLNGDIGYIDFDSFTQDSYNEFKEALDDIKKHNPKGLIIDLRDNTGGYVDAALKIADLFAEKDKVLLIQEDKNGHRSEKTALSDPQIKIPTVILVNGYTASASEILTGIFKDYGLATIVGTQTYGKGVIQTIILNSELNAGGGVLKVTTEEYFTPKENKINKIGITPDVEIQLDENYDGTNKEEDNQIQKAIEILKK